MNKSNLTVKQRSVVDNYFSNGFDKKKALVDAGYKEKNINQSVYNFFKSPRVQAEIQARQQRIEAECLINVEQLQKELWKNHVIAIDEGKISDSNRALQLLGQTIGAFTEKVEVTENSSLADILDKVEKLAEHGEKKEHVN